MNATMTKAAINIIGRDKISGMANDFISSMLKAKDAIEMQPGECEVFLMLYKGENGVAYSAVAFIDKDDRIVRYDNVISLQEFINKSLEEI